MGRTAGRILKGDSVKLEGRVHLDVVQAPVGDKQALPKEKNAASDMPQVCVVENQPEFAVIEIACSCGTKTHLRCEYAGAESSVDQVSDHAK